VTSARYLGWVPQPQARHFWSSPASTTPKTYEGISLQFRVHDLADIADKLRGHVEFLGPEERPWGSVYLYLEDPTGIQVILYEGEV
jgi:hypothetical protein